ncbi:MAG: TGS domain-containing protein [Nitrososphaerales archaeon]
MTDSKFEVYQVLLNPIVSSFKISSINLQLIFTPYDPELSYEKNERFLNMSRTSDLLLITVSDENYLYQVLEWYENHNIEVRATYPSVEIKLTSSGGVRILGSSKNFDEKTLLNFLSSYGVKDALVNLSRDSTLDDVEATLYGREFKKVLFLSYKEDLNFLKEFKKDSLSLKDFNREDLLDKILDKLDLIRVYTKGIGRDISKKPLLVKRSMSILDVAKEIHEDLVRNFKFAKVWRKNVLYTLKVGANFKVQDGDVIEIHA